MSTLSGLELHPCLRARTHRVRARPKSLKTPGDNDGFVLYIPTVCLRHDQNPAFAVACHAANRLRMPLVVLAVVVDDASHARPASPHRFPPPADDHDNAPSSSSVVMTSRRLAFALQALSHACALWSAHGAAVGIRIHAGAHPGVAGARSPDHLTLASRASFVVVDEPFVSPFATLVSRVEEACDRSNVECVRVDGSCTVPPVQVLRKRNAGGGGDEVIKFDGVPVKAYMWQKKTEHLRESHLRAAMEGHFDAPKLDIEMDDEDLFAPLASPQKVSPNKDEEPTGKRLAHLFPSRWKSKTSNDACGDTSGPSLPSAPDVRPFTSRELSRLYQNDDYIVKGSVKSNTQQPTRNDRVPFHNFAMSWPGADPSVPPCTQTIGTTSHGMHRWNTFVQTKLPRYGKNRNDARLVHASSRMSAYLNLGIVSIFRLVGEVKRQQREQNTTKGASATQPMRRSRWDKSGADKLEEEIVKFREMSYAHAFSRDDYDDVSTLPQWGVTCLNNHPNVSRYTLKQLANGTTGDATWNAMQRYLANTGELHNNVRMTWGKTVVEWVGCSASPAANVGGVDCSPAQLTLRTLCYLNDRYALDGLSPPSYAGLLWCAGWSDKPSGSGTWTISKKPAHRYRLKAEEFGKAERKLLTNPQLGQLAIGEGSGSDVVEAGMKRQRSVLDMMKMQSAGASTLNAPKKGKAEPKYDEHGSERSPSSRGTKRNTNSTTISSFFVKDPKKGKKNYSRIVG